MDCNDNLFITYASRIIPSLESHAVGGGIRSSLVRAALASTRQGTSDVLSIISGDSRGFEDPVRRLRVLPFGPIESQLLQRLFGMWYDDFFALLCPDGYRKADQDIPGLYVGDYEAPTGSLDRVFEHISKYGTLGPPFDDLRTHAGCLCDVMDEVQSRSTLIWTDFYFATSVLRHAQFLRQRGVKQVYHNRMAIPEGLSSSEQGRFLLRAMGSVDVVYVHTDVFRRRLESQLAEIDCEVEVRRFDIGPDTLTLDDGLEKFHTGGLESAFSAVSTLSDNQRKVVDDMLLTVDQVPHRFVCLDRIDPVKGVHILIDSIDQFLSSRSMTESELRANFRFYFLASFFERPSDITNDLSVKKRYCNIVRDRLRDLAARYPGVVLPCDNIPIRPLLAVLLRDAHSISATVQEGMNVSVQEGAYVNAILGYPRTVIVSQGAGFALQTIEDGSGDLAFFPEAGSVQAFTQALVDVVETDPPILRNMNMELVEKAIAHRTKPITEYR